MLCTRLITSNVLPYLQPFDIEHHLDVMKEKKGSECDWKLHKMLVYCPLNKMKVSCNYYCLLTATVRTLQLSTL
jgi:hypothetical protein